MIFVKKKFGAIFFFSLTLSCSLSLLRRLFVGAVVAFLCGTLITFIALPLLLPSLPPPPSPPPPLTDDCLVLVGDWGNFDGDQLSSGADSVFSSFSGLGCSSLVSLGDNVYDNGLSGRPKDPALTSLLAVLRTVRKRIPHLFALLGNHDYRGSISSLLTPSLSKEWSVPGRVWAADFLGCLRVVALDTNPIVCELEDISRLRAYPEVRECKRMARGLSTSPMTAREVLSWAEETIEASLTKVPGLCGVLVAGHHAVFSSVRGDNEVLVRALHNDLFSRFSHNPLFLGYLSGHDHSLQRRTADNVRYFVVGAGGDYLQRLKKRSASKALFERGELLGYAVLRAKGGSLTIEFREVGKAAPIFEERLL
jgi:hypothetical protein